MMRVSGLSEKNGAGGRTSVPHLYVEPSCDARRLSLASGEALERAQNEPGLCTQKFSADITTGGVDYSRLAPGVTLRVGGAVIEISSAVKRCFDECPIRARGGRCPIYANCAFARVVSGGVIRPGDDISFLDPTTDKSA